MAKSRTKEIFIKESRGEFFLFRGSSKSDDKYNFDGLDSLRKLLSKEKARILDVIKYKKPSSIYQLSKILKRPFKAVFDDVKLLEKFEFIKIVLENKGKRVRHKPEIVVEQITINFKI